MATISPAIDIHNQWEATLTVSPDRVLTDNAVRLTVTLSHQDFSGVIPYDNFTYEFHSSDPSLQTELDALRGGRNRIVSLTIPRLPEGRYEVSVTVTEHPLGDRSPITPRFPPERTAS